MGARDASPTKSRASQNSIKQASISAIGSPDIARLLARLGDDPLALIAVFVAPSADFAAVMQDVRRFAVGVRVIGCTTAGEISEAGYDEDRIVAVGFPAARFAADAVCIKDLSTMDEQVANDRIIQARVALSEAHPDKHNGFAFLLVDGLSLSEDRLVAGISPAMAEFPLFGGSAGDGTRFEQTFVAADGWIGSDAAVLALIRSTCATKVFTLNHLDPEEIPMVVTEADPVNRIVKEINAEPAGREYARIVGKDPNQLDPFTFAAHPVTVRIGDEHHVRSIQRVNENGELVFFSAVDEGMVLRVARPGNMPQHLDQQLSELGGGILPDAVLACDCILRRIEAQQGQQLGEVSKVLERYNVMGFSTYGEQYGPLHVNQTMTGVAFFTSCADAAE